MTCGSPAQTISPQDALHLAAQTFRRPIGCSPASCRFAAVILCASRSGMTSEPIAFRTFARSPDCCPQLFLCDPTLADSLVESLGGERTLFNQFHSQIPWTTPPTIDSDGMHGRTVRSNWHHISERHQLDPHETVCEICETLIALSPRSEAAACDAVDPSGKDNSGRRLQALVEEHPAGQLALQSPRCLECRVSPNTTRQNRNRQSDRLHRPDGNSRSQHGKDLPLHYREMDQGHTDFERGGVGFRNQSDRR